MIPRSRSPRVLLLAPVMVLAHVAEETPGLVAWLNRHADPDLTMSGFYALNAFGVLLTAALAVPSVRSRSRELGLGLLAWLGFVMLANGLLHLLASLAFGEYVPGSVTAGLLYLPYFVVATATIRHHFEISLRAAVLTITIGAVPMLVQGFGILVLGRRILW